ncbi:hypothetical protein HDV05_007523 [Chytridiales sp. JEL 0842]|nr:hypothetical protein HDV05_007523 [Chytridiales sp. JEL 0842]
MGACSGPHSYKVKYSTHDQIVRTEHPLLNAEGVAKPFRTTLSEKLKSENTFFQWLSYRMDQHGMSLTQPPAIHFLEKSGSSYVEDPSVKQPDFLFWGGMVGYFGYEMKCETLATHPNTTNHDPHMAFKTVSARRTPDAAFIFADRFLAFDHELQQVFLIALDVPDFNQVRGRISDWFNTVSHQLASASKTFVANATQFPTPSSSPSPKDTQQLYPKLRLRHTRTQYISNIQKSLGLIKEGETYEVCLTTHVQASVPVNDSTPAPLEVYMQLRKKNPAPYAAFIEFDDSLCILSSSPERFIRCDKDGWIEMKPIKGTVGRPNMETFLDKEGWEAEDARRKNLLQSNEKDRAENLMIVDLIRNDLNQIAQSHTVCVPSLMNVESYATVHQLVTTVKAHLHPSLSPVDAIKAVFPPGSMTGAPKLSTVNILEELEGIGEGRGVYSGCLGFISMRGEMDMSVVIRTAVLTKSEKRGTSTLDIEVGAGGAVVYMSDPVAEYEEMVLKAQSVLPSIIDMYGCIGLDTLGSP